MSTNKLDQIVKGAPAPGSAAALAPSTSSELVPLNAPPQLFRAPSTSLLPQSPPDPTSSSPPQIYLNLLILEASIRSQYLSLRDRRRQNTFFIFLLSVWVTGFTYALFLRPREDGVGIGGSVYWVVETLEKVALMGGVMTAVLIWGTGQWERGIRWPRRWLSVANRGLRTINTKIVIIKGPWWKELLGYFVFIFPYSALFPASADSFAYGAMDHWSAELNISPDEDLSPGGDYIKLLLLPKPFSPEFRENWEIYRLEYWEKENERRARLRDSVKRRQIDYARKEGGLFWWAVRHKPRHTLRHPSHMMNEKTTAKQHQEKGRQRRHSFVRSESHSRTISRSATPSVIDSDELSGGSVRGASATGTIERKRKTRPPTTFTLEPVVKASPISRPA